MLVGLAISYGVLLPIRTAGNLPADTLLLSAVGSVFSEVRFIGAGTMAIAAIWTLVKITTPVVKGIQGALGLRPGTAAGTSVDVTERDIPITWVGIVVVVSLIPIGFLLWDFASGTAIHHGVLGIVITSIAFVFVVGLLVAAVCGYMAGLIDRPTARSRVSHHRGDRRRAP